MRLRASFAAGKKRGFRLRFLHIGSEIHTGACASSFATERNHGQPSSRNQIFLHAASQFKIQNPSKLNHIRTQDAPHDVVHRDAFGLGVESRHDAVAQHGEREGVDVVNRDVESALQDGADFSGEHEILARARAGAPLISSFTNAGASGFVRARDADDIEHEVHDVIGHGDFADDFLQFENLRAAEHGLDVGDEGARGARDDLPLLVAARVADFHEEKETVALRLGQRIGAFLLDGILRREDEERLVEIRACCRRRSRAFPASPRAARPAFSAACG